MLMLSFCVQIFIADSSILTDVLLRKENEDLLEAVIRHHSVAAGSLGSWGKTIIEMIKNLISSLYVRSHVWSLQKRFDNWTELLYPSTTTCFVETTTAAETEFLLDPEARVVHSCDMETTSEEG